MSNKYISKKDFAPWVASLVKEHELHGPVSKKSKFVLGRITNVEQLQLQYDYVMLPPKQYIFPTYQDMLKFDAQGLQQDIQPQERVLFGIHPYDIVAINQLDILFTENKEDVYWTANRAALTIIGSNVINHSPAAFFGSMNSWKPKTGFDIFLTDIGDGYVAEVATEKGSSLLNNSFTDATETQITDAETTNRTAAENCPQKIAGAQLNNETQLKEIAQKTIAQYDSNLWHELSERCFSCGTCNLVCPTCYCFDVQDVWNLDGVSGKRYRRWDGCLTREFSEATIQGGHHNFRNEREERYRHRIMRKLAYLNTKLGGPACVGCGRCTIGCTANIANPLDTVVKVQGA